MSHNDYYQIDFTKEDLGLSTYALAKQTDVESIVILTDVELEKVNNKYTGCLLLDFTTLGDILQGDFYGEIY